jgi:hypothetical protein
MRQVLTEMWSKETSDDGNVLADAAFLFLQKLEGTKKSKGIDERSSGETHLGVDFKNKWDCKLFV